MSALAKTTLRSVSWCLDMVTDKVSPPRYRLAKTWHPIPYTMDDVCSQIRFDQEWRAFARGVYIARYCTVQSILFKHIALNNQIAQIMTSPKHIIFYDIASGPPITPFAPNPWKTRYALNFKGVHYKTEWVELTQVENVRKKLGAAPVRTFRDGSPFYTLPVIQDLSTGDVVGDSFDIALYLDKTYPNSSTLFPPSTIGLHAAFNAQVDAIFSQAAILLAHGIRFNPETAEKSKADFVWRAGKEKWADLNPEGEERKRVLETFKTALGELAKIYERSNGPFLEGEKASYADLIVGGWLMYLSQTLKEWDEVKNWHSGLWKRQVHAGQLERTKIKSINGSSQRLSKCIDYDMIMFE